MNEPIRVAQVMGKMSGGGVEQVVMNYYTHIDRSRVQFDFIVDSDSELIPREEIESLGGRVFTVPPYQHPFVYQRALVSLYREQGWKIVHSHENVLSVFPLRAAERVGIPIRIAHSHSTAGRGEPLRNLVKRILKLFSNVYPTHRMACSYHAGEWLFGNGTDFKVLHNAIDLGRFSYDAITRNNMRSNLGLADNQLVIGHVGRFVPQKNHIFLIDVFAEIAKRRKDAVLLLVGSGKDQSAIKKQVNERGIADRVRFLGHRTDVDKLYQAFDVFVLPSLYEGLGTVAIEAQKAGLPCFLSNQVPREANVSGTAQFLALNDPMRWISALCRQEPCERFEVCNEKFRDYDISVVSKDLENYYLKVFAMFDKDIR